MRNKSNAEITFTPLNMTHLNSGSSVLCFSEKLHCHSICVCVFHQSLNFMRYIQRNELKDRQCTHCHCNLFLKYVQDFLTMPHVLHVKLRRLRLKYKVCQCSFKLELVEEGGVGKAAAWPPGKTLQLSPLQLFPFDLPNLSFKEEGIQSSQTDTSWYSYPDTHFTMCAHKLLAYATKCPYVCNIN